MRTRAKVDANQREIVQALRKAGVRVLHLHQLGKGVPDLLGCFRGYTALLEIKAKGEKPNQAQKEFHAEWGGEIHVVHSAEEAIEAMTGQWTGRRDPVYGTPWR